MRILAFRALAASLLVIASMAFAAEPGWFGISVTVDADGIFNPVLRSIKVVGVAAGSPAAAAGLAPGDVLVEIQGVVVAGGNAGAVKAAMRKAPGEKLDLRYQRGDDPPRTATLVAALKPPDR